MPVLNLRTIVVLVYTTEISLSMTRSEVLNSSQNDTQGTDDFLNCRETNCCESFILA